MTGTTKYKCAGERCWRFYRGPAAPGVKTWHCEKCARRSARKRKREVGSEAQASGQQEKLFLDKLSPRQQMANWRNRR